MDFTTQLAPWLGAIGTSLVDLDEDKSGADDFCGELLIYVADVGASIQDGQDLPEFPELLALGTSGRITGVLKSVLRVVNPLLTFARFQVRDPKAQRVLRYVSQALTLLLADRPVPAFVK